MDAMLLGLGIMFVAFALPFCIVHSLTQKYSYATIVGIVALALLILWAGAYDNTQSDGVSKSLFPVVTMAVAQISADAKGSASISNAIEPSNSDVRAYALSAINASSGGSYNIHQICDIYDKLYRDWVYVNDPSGADYYVPASESVKLLKGDCDDYAILMASLIESIGGSARVVVASNSWGGHAYTEVYISDSKSDVEGLVASIQRRYGKATVNYHISYDEDSNPEYWLNLDWTSNRPGGTFYQSTGTVLLIRPNGYYERVAFNPN